MRARTWIALTLTLAVAAPASAATPLLRLDGIGPLKLGMSRTSAVATGWLAQRHSGCPLGGPPLPVVYNLAGRQAPAGIRGDATFNSGDLTVLAFTRGVHTAAGVVAGKTTASGMARLYRRAGFKVSSHYESTFGGTFVDVKRNGKQVLGGFAEKGKPVVLGLPAVPVCE